MDKKALANKVVDIFREEYDRPLEIRVADRLEALGINETILWQMRHDGRLFRRNKTIAECEYYAVLNELRDRRILGKTTEKL